MTHHLIQSIATVTGNPFWPDVSESSPWERGSSCIIGPLPFTRPAAHANSDQWLMLMKLEVEKEDARLRLFL